MKTEFGRGKWNPDAFIRSYSYRFTETPDFTQEDDCIASAANPTHREDFDNISLLTRETYAAGTRVQIHCAFEALGCPEIILVPAPEACPDGAVRYGACFEVVLYKDGINVWRHDRKDGNCFWHKRMGVLFPVAESEIHTLCVEILEKDLRIAVDDRRMELRVEDLPERFHTGVTVCEGVARVYDLKTEII